MSNHSFLLHRLVSSSLHSWRTNWKVPRARRERTRLPHTLYSQPIVPSQRFRIPEQIWSSSSSSSSRRRRLVASLRDGKIASLLARRKATSPLSRQPFSRLGIHIYPHLLSLPCPPITVLLCPFYCLSRLPHVLLSRIFLLLALRGSTFVRAIVPWRLYGGPSVESQTRHVREVTDSNEAKARKGARWLFGFIQRAISRQSLTT